MEYWDIYILKEKRVAAELFKYAARLIPGFDLNRNVGDFSINVREDQLKVSTAEEFINSGCFHEKSEGGIRLIGTQKENINGGWVYFNHDGTVVFGISVKEAISKTMLSTLKKETESAYGYIAGDCPPASTAKEFSELCAK